MNRSLERRLRSYDGTELAYYADGPDDAPALVLCAGLGGGNVVWRPFFERFADRYRVVSWDYRGLYASDAALDPDAYSVPHHARDLLALVEHEELQSPTFVGWSMGVQVCLELHRHEPGLAAALVAIHGTFGRPLATAFDSPATMERVVPLVLGLLRGVGDRLGPFGPFLARNPLVVEPFVWAGRRLGWMSERLDIEAFRQVAESWTQLDLATYADIFEHLDAHDAAELLPSIDTPTLVIAGERDRFTPPHLSRRMVDEMPRARLEMLPQATHFGLIEYAKEIVDAIERFVEHLDPKGEPERPAP